MRHGKKFNHLGRTAPHRKAMLSNMAASLIEHKRINTTVAKAKELRKFIEPLVTKSKEDSTHSRRVVFGYLQNKYAVNELFREIAPKVADRPGGYVRILKTGNRLGDNAEMCFIEFVDYNETYIKTDKKKGGKSRRSRRGGKGKAAAADAPETVEATSEEVVEEAAVAEEIKNDVEVVVEESPAEEAPVAEAKEEAPAEAEAKSEEPVAEAAPEAEAKVEEAPAEAEAKAEEAPEAEAKSEEAKDEAEGDDAEGDDASKDESKKEDSDKKE